MIGLAGRTALVTGGNRGIGREAYPETAKGSTRRHYRSRRITAIARLLQLQLHFDGLERLEDREGFERVFLSVV